MALFNLKEMEIAIFVKERPASPGLPYWAGIYRGAGEYLLIVTHRRIVGAVQDPHDKPGFAACCKAAREEAAKRGFHDIQLVEADGSGGKFFLKHEEDAAWLPVRRYKVPSVYGGLHENLEVLEE